MSKAYFKTNDAAVLTAMKQHQAEAEVASTAGKAFADHYGGMLLVQNDLHEYRVSGLCFRPAKDDPLWTKPDPKRANMQRPRTSIKNATKEQKAALAELQAGWKARFPQQKSDFAPVLEAMGTHWGNLFFCGFAMFQHDGFIYASTGVKLAPCMQEILGSEYQAAQDQFDAARNALKAAA